MTQEIRAAAERLRRLEAGEHQDAVYGDFANAFRRLDTQTLADAFLAEHPADDDEPDTEEWLRGVGFTDCKNDGLRLSILARYPNLGMPFWEVCGTVIRLAQPKTRGQLRRLCAALGISLKETA